jgi:hypothetical protein
VGNALFERIGSGTPSKGMMGQRDYQTRIKARQILRELSLISSDSDNERTP